MKPLALLLLSITLCLTATWPAQAGNPKRTDAATIPARIALHKIWSQSVAANVDSSPAYLAHVHLKDGSTAAMVYVLAGNNGSNCSPSNPVRQSTLYALNAQSGAIVWSRATSGPTRCTTAGPRADPSGTWVYAGGFDGLVHRYDAGTGTESSDGGWPVRYTLMPDVEKLASTPTIGKGYLYVTTSGFIGDAGHYQGHLVSINLKTGHSTVFNSLCSTIAVLLGPTRGAANYCPDVQSGLFGRGQGAVDPITHDVYIVSGNGPWNGRTNWGDSILKLDPSGKKLLDSYTPTDQDYLNSSDLDLGSTGPAILPTLKRKGATFHLLVQGGKGPACQSCSGVVLRLLNRDNLSGKHATGHLGGDLQNLPTPGGCATLTAPAVWTSPSHEAWVFYADSCGTAGYRLAPANGSFRLKQVWTSGESGTTPVIAANVLYVARGGAIAAFNPLTGALLGRTSEIGGVHWQYPRVVGNRLFMSDQTGHVLAFSITTG